MKKLILGFLFIVSLTSSSQAQIMLGYSVKDVKETLDSEGLIIYSGYTKTDSIFYITGKDNTLYRVYYFNQNNECIAYLLFSENSTELELSKILIENDYYKVGDTFYNNIYKVKISYDADLKMHYYTWTLK